MAQNSQIKILILDQPHIKPKISTPLGFSKIFNSKLVGQYYGSVEK